MSIEIRLKRKYQRGGRAKKGAVTGNGNSGGGKRYDKPPVGIRSVPKGRTRHA